MYEQQGGLHMAIFIVAIALLGSTVFVVDALRAFSIDFVGVIVGR
jgi:hypothetical protein